MTTPVLSKTDPSLTVLTLRVRFVETDLMGIVHHASYLAYFEAGRVEWLRRRGVTYAEWAARGMHLPVVEVNLRYRAAALFDDLLDIETRLTELRGVSMRYDYRIVRHGEGTLLTEGSTRLACVNGARELTRIPPNMVAIFKAGETVAARPFAT
jgi:acyl-CoA thioester hydrolase